MVTVMVGCLQVSSSGHQQSHHLRLPPYSCTVERGVPVSVLLLARAMIQQEVDHLPAAPQGGAMEDRLPPPTHLQEVLACHPTFLLMTPWSLVHASTRLRWSLKWQKERVIQSSSQSPILATGLILPPRPSRSQSKETNSHGCGQTLQAGQTLFTLE